MFSKMVFRNSVRSHKENALFMSSLIISIIAFYVVLSLSSQDVMRYLKTLESEAIQKLFAMIGVLYGFTLFIIFALVFFASRFQIERRSHEFGVYIMMGMKRSKLFFMLLLEDLSSSLIALLVGLPVSVLVTEVISLLTVKMVGIGFMGHQTTFSLHAVLLTAAGFAAVKLASVLILSFLLLRKEVGTLLSDAPDNVRKKNYPVIQAILFLLGALLLILAYRNGVSGTAWERTTAMGQTVLLGIVGTLLLFRGMRFLIGLIARKIPAGKLRVFTFRQIEDTVIFKSGSMAICSILILVAAACLAAGISIFCSFNLYDTKRVDYTLTNTFNGGNTDLVKKIDEIGLSDKFSYLGILRISHPYNAVEGNDFDSAFSGEGFEKLRDQLDPEFKGHYEYRRLDGFPFMIRLSDFNALMTAHGEEAMMLSENELGLYRSASFNDSEELDNEALAQKPHVTLAGKDFVMTGKVQKGPIVSDSYITLSGALIVPDETFDALAGDKTEIYVNGILDRSQYTRDSMVELYTEINRKMDRFGLPYESYLSNMGRQLFYLVAASYITIYLALIFLVVANTILGVQFLMGQKRTARRYKTLVKLGADHSDLYSSSKKQVNWFFGIPILVATVSTYFAVRALFQGILSSRTKLNISAMLPIVVVVVAVFALVEYLYMHIVKRSSSRFLATLMTPEREE